MGSGHTQTPLSTAVGQAGLCVGEVAGLPGVYCLAGVCCVETTRNKHRVGRQNLPFSRNCSWRSLGLEQTEPRLRASSTPPREASHRRKATAPSLPQKISLFDFICLFEGGLSLARYSVLHRPMSARRIPRPVPGKVN